jgi:hypothetical protein
VGDEGEKVSGTGERRSIPRPQEEEGITEPVRTLKLGSHRARHCREKVRAMH